MSYLLTAMLVIAGFVAALITNRNKKSLEAIPGPGTYDTQNSLPPSLATPGTPIPEPVATSTLAGPAGLPPETNQEKLYRTAARFLGYPMKLDHNVPNLYACASSLSGILQKAGVHGLPALGIPGTAALNAWLASSGYFMRVNTPQPGDIVMSPSPANPAPGQLAHGHCGVLANHGICSNDSDTGLWREEWTLPRWLNYYGSYGKLPVLYYRWITR